MRRTLALLLLWLLPVIALAQPTPLSALRDDPEWREIFEAISADISRYSKFKEIRRFSFTKHPVELVGEMRRVPGKGVSLYYPKDGQIVIIDARGVLLRDARGHNRAMPKRSASHGPLMSLESVLQFDVERLALLFELSGERTDSGWTLYLSAPQRPSDEPAAIVVEGVERRIARIKIRREGAEQLEIRIVEARENVNLPPDEIARFFRHP